MAVWMRAHSCWWKCFVTCVGFCWVFPVLFPRSAGSGCRGGEVWFIPDNGSVGPAHNMRQKGLRGSLWQGLFSLPFRSQLQYVIIFSLVELWNYSGRCIFIFISPFTPVVFLECLTTFFFFFSLHLFFWKWFKRHLEELMRQFAIYLGVFFFLLGAIQSHLEAIEWSHWLWGAMGEALDENCCESIDN